MAQSRVKSIQAPVFKTRTTAVPQNFWKALLVRSEGAGVTNLLEEWGAPDLGSSPAITLLVSARETSGRITSSKLVARGPLFRAAMTNPVKANTIWPGVDAAITLRFAIQGETLNFSNKEARNFSLWTSLDSLTNYRVFKGDEQLSPDDIKDIEGIKDGACFRVAVHSYSVSQMEASLLIIPASLDKIREKADTWKVAMESNVLPAVNLTSHWTRYVPHTVPDCLSPERARSQQTVQPWADLSQSLTVPARSQELPHSPQTVSARADPLAVTRTAPQSADCLTPFITGTEPLTWWTTSPEKTLARSLGSASSLYWRYPAVPRWRTSPSPPPTAWRLSCAPP